MTSLIPRPRAHHILITSVVLGLAGGCASGTSLDGLGPPLPAEAGPTPVVNVKGMDGGPRDDRDGSALQLNPLCGTTNLCGSSGLIPDDTDPCVDGDGGARVGVHGKDASVRSKDAGISDASKGGGPDAQGIRPDASQDIRDAGLDGGDADAHTHLESPPIPALPPLPDAGPRSACQVSTDDLGKPVHKCLPAGTGKTGEACTFPSDCAPGFACVGASPAKAGEALPATGGLCVPYCCRLGSIRLADGGVREVCDPGKYCTERPLLDRTTKTPLIVPVCVEGIPCDVLEPFPCTAKVCMCPSDMACTLVRSDGTNGTTGCQAPGKGTVGQGCPCAPGYYCSMATETCVKLCKTDGTDKRCDPGKCQATAGFPPGLGLCVGSAPTAR